MSDSLESGTYTIHSKVDDAPIGRQLVEDRSLNPKRIFKLPNSMVPPVWDIEKLDNGHYQCKTRNAVVAADAGRLWAYMIEAPKGEWVVRPDEKSEGNAFVVLAADDSGDGWVVNQDNESDQIAVRHLIVGPSFPPFYPPNQVFVFTKIDY